MISVLRRIEITDTKWAKSANNYDISHDLKLKWKNSKSFSKEKGSSVNKGPFKSSFDI